MNIIIYLKRYREDKRKEEIKDTHLFLHSLIFPQSLDLVRHHDPSLSFDFHFLFFCLHYGRNIL